MTKWVPTQQTGFAHPTLSWLLSAVLFATVAGPAKAQTAAVDQPVTISSETLPQPEVNALLERLDQLESNKRWGEALSVYEDSLREYRNNETLRLRHDIAKLHYSLDRRYRDQSFRRSIASLNRQESLALYSELLQKTNTHHVHSPAWRTLGVRGTRAVELALADQDFLNTNNIQLSADRHAALRDELHQLLSQKNLDTSHNLVGYVSEVAQLLEARARLNPTASVLEFVAAAADGLDDYSAYLTADQLREVYSQIEGNFVGLGVELKAEEGALLIVHVIPNSPAQRSGIQANDRIVAVDGKSTAEMSTDEAAAMLTGAEGSWVRVTAYTNGSQPRVLNIRREHVEVPSLEGVKICDPDFGIAYIRIPAFQKATARDLEAALWDLHRQGMRSLILDLRHNPGGLLTSSVEVADKFLTKGNIVSTRGRRAQEDFNYQAHYGGTWRVPLVVLIDGDSASASEIFAGAIKDNNRGQVIGTTSYGKGSVQGIFPLGFAGAGIRLTTAKFFSPNGVPINHRGVDPHVVVEPYRVAKPVFSEIADNEPHEDEDAVLEAAVAAARSRLAAR
ncbi:MAG: S41 family peptidase [Pirellulales bacterium]|nr:S41 family peptidase [Pirellulales bacterium]